MSLTSYPRPVSRIICAQYIIIDRNIDRLNVTQMLCLLMFTSVLAGGDKRRIDELWACAKVLGIPEANITIIM